MSLPITALLSSLGYGNTESVSVRTLKALLARLAAVEKDIQREENRLEKATFSHASADVINSIGNMLSALSAEKQRLSQLIDAHIDNDPTLKNDAELLTDGRLSWGRPGSA